ncbi:MAG: hypothetical protein ACOCX4_04055 [Planctomycetota bacterium]
MRTRHAVAWALACVLLLAGCDDPTTVNVETGENAPELVLENVSHAPITIAITGPLADPADLEGPVHLRIDIDPGKTATKRVPPGRYGYDAYGSGLRGAAGYVELHPQRRYRMRFFLVDPDAPPPESAPALLEEGTASTEQADPDADAPATDTDAETAAP